MTDLLNCPFCGGAAVLIQGSLSPYACCVMCHSAGPICQPGAQEAASAWNNRARACDSHDASSVSSRTRRWNIEQDESGLLICDGSHDKSEPCQYVRYTRSSPHAPVSPDSDLLKEAVGLLDWIAGDVEEGITITRGMAGSIRAFLSKVEERGHD